MNDRRGGYDYPPEVRFEVDQDDPEQYRLAAEFLNMNRVGAVIVQHEYGIFGGEQGSYLLGMLDHLRMPLVTTLHTVLRDPEERQRDVLLQLAERSDCLVVLSELSRSMLLDAHGIAEDRITVIPHGIPDIPFVDPNFYKDQFGVEGKRVLLTFGLLSPGKGLEYALRALPEVVDAVPDVVYLIVGATHPHVWEHSGEEYRISLQQLARELGVEEHVRFINRFVSQTELVELLGASDIYVTPYLQEAQAVSGTLAYALGAGKAIVSTPYWYAQEMLAEGRGRLAPFRDAHGLAEHIIDLFRHPVQMTAMRKRAYAFSRDMRWSRVARAYVSTIETLREERVRKYYSVYLAGSARPEHFALPALNIRHLRLLTDDTGILQHARFTVPRKSHGYTTDDNARALIAAVLAGRHSGETAELEDLASRYLAFLEYAFDPWSGSFRNFMSYTREWLEERGSEDSHGRALWALGTTVGFSRLDGQVGVAMELFERALDAVAEFSSPRAWAFALLGIDAYRKRYAGARTTRALRDRLAERLYSQYKGYATADWPWLEDRLTYANARIPHGLLAAARDMGREDIIEAAVGILDWLCRVQTGPAGRFAPIGNVGWYLREAEPARYDQQPLEAECTVSACLAANHITGDERWIGEATRAFEWFLGRNDPGTPVYDHVTGGCHDGIQAEGINQNEGAESTLSWLLSLLAMMEHRSITGLNAGTLKRRTRSMAHEDSGLS
jgi:glycosyltransferase involved in cell wall biosynthesis